MSLPIVADADTLFPATTRGLLIYLDFGGLIRLHWSPMILDEVARALVDAGRKKTLDDAKAHETRMQDALPHALVATRDVQAQFASGARSPLGQGRPRRGVCPLSDRGQCVWGRPGRCIGHSQYQGFSQRRTGKAGHCAAQAGRVSSNAILRRSALHSVTFAPI